MIIYCVRIKLYNYSISRYINISDSVADSVIFINFVAGSIRFYFSTSVKLFSSVSLFVLYVICLKIYSSVLVFVNILTSSGLDNLIHQENEMLRLIVYTLSE